MFAIVGAGNVVTRLLIPALAWHGIPASDLRIYGTPDDPTHLDTPAGRVPVDRHPPGDIPARIAAQELTPWLATPPARARRDLIAACEGRKYVCEKPLGASRDDLDWLTGHPQLLTDCFALSYYVQEKWAPLLWQTTRLEPPARLAGDVCLDPPEHGTITSCRIELSEPQTRSDGRQISSWQTGRGGLDEFAIHAAALVSNLGLDVTACARGNQDITFTGPGVHAHIQRPGPARRIAIVGIDGGTITADASQRSAALTRGAGTPSQAAIPSSVPSYGVVTSYVLEWLGGTSAYAGDLDHQLAALDILTRGADVAETYYEAGREPGRTV